MCAMLRVVIFLWLCIAVAKGYIISPRDEPQLTDETKAALKDAGIDISELHVRPKQKVEHILAIGDSYTAGIGSDGTQDEIGSTKCSRYNGAWPIQLRNKNDWNDINDGHRPDLTFGACSGNLMKDLREKQLKQGDPVDTEKNDYTPIGKPQIAVLTISGNDVLFSKVINDCVYRLWILGKMKGCDQRLREVEGMIDSTNFKNDILNTYLSIVAAGRCAGGANPMASFQVFVGGYVGLWNHHDEPCDHVYWNYIGWGLTYKQWLTRSLRKRMNDLVDKLNRVVKEAAEELKPYGVFYVEGYNDGFMGRRFCEHYKHNCIHHRAFQDRNGENGFWSYKSRAFRGDEGWPAERICDWDLISLENGNPPELAEEEDLLLRDISEVLVPNEEDRKKLSDELGPWNVTEGDWDQYDDIFEALLDRGQHDPMKAKSVWDKYFRLFHPKASGYAYFADKWMEAIKANRDDPADKPADEPAKAGKTLQLFWQVEPGPEMPINDFPLSEDEYLWKFYLGDTGTGSNPCNTDPVDIKTNGEAPKDNPPTVVNGEWEFDLPDMGKCKFQGIGRVGESGENGWLHCQTRPAIMCKPDERPIDDCGTDNIVRSKAISFCDW